MVLGLCLSSLKHWLCSSLDTHVALCAGSKPPSLHIFLSFLINHYVPNVNHVRRSEAPQSPGNPTIQDMQTSQACSAAHARGTSMLSMTWGSSFDRHNRLSTNLECESKSVSSCEHKPGNIRDYCWICEFLPYYYLPRMLQPIRNPNTRFPKSIEDSALLQVPGTPFKISQPNRAKVRTAANRRLDSDLTTIHTTMFTPGAKPVPSPSSQLANPFCHLYSSQTQIAMDYVADQVFSQHTCMPISPGLTLSFCETAMQIGPSSATKAPDDFRLAKNISLAVQKLLD